jgi:hypothetical protein
MGDYPLQERVPILQIWKEILQQASSRSWEYISHTHRLRTFLIFTLLFVIELLFEQRVFGKQFMLDALKLAIAAIFAAVVAFPFVFLLELIEVIPQRIHAARATPLTPASGTQVITDRNPITGRIPLNQNDFVFHSPYHYRKTNPEQPLCPRCFISDAACPMGQPRLDESGIEHRRCTVCNVDMTPFGEAVIDSDAEDQFNIFLSEPRIERVIKHDGIFLIADDARDRFSIRGGFYELAWVTEISNRPHEDFKVGYAGNVMAELLVVQERSKLSISPLKWIGTSASRVNLPFGEPETLILSMGAKSGSRWVIPRASISTPVEMPTGAMEVQLVISSEENVIHVERLKWEIAKGDDIPSIGFMPPMSGS